MIDYLPYIIAIISLIGSAATFFLTSRQRDAKVALDRADTAQKIAESYSSLVQSLQKQVRELERDLNSERNRREEAVTRLENDLREERARREMLEKQIARERRARIEAETRVTELAGRVSALELENKTLKAENAQLKSSKK